jgi:serine/threonine protein kinase
MMTIDRFGKYQLFEEIEKTGSAVTYTAGDALLDGTVTLRILNSGLSEDEVFRSRFIRHARLLGRLDHPAIIRTIDTGQSEGRLYIATETANGETLDQILKRTGVLPPEQSISILRQVADALDYAHSLGAIHGSLRPACITVSGAGSVKITWFSISHDPDPALLMSARQYLDGSTYAAPEQLCGGRAHPCADRYSLGLIAYEMLMGGRPSEQETRNADMRKALAKMLSKRRGARYRSARMFVDTLASALSEPDPAEVKPGDGIRDSMPSMPSGAK